MFLSSATWDKYARVINGVNSDFNQDGVLWKRSLVTRSNTEPVPRFNEQEQNESTDYDYIPLLVLLDYNYFRKWPLTKETESGELDNQNMAMILNRKYLSDLGYLTSEGYFDFQPDKDYFIHRGIKYKAEGDTLVSQANNNPLLFQIILHRKGLLTGEERYEIEVNNTFDDFFDNTFRSP